MAFAILFLIPAIIAILFFVFTKSTITLKEFLLQMTIQAVIAGVSVGVIYKRNTWDTEVLNGQVSSKTRDRVSCSHSYSCNCYQSCSGSGSSRSCTRICSTCYEHSYDVSWRVHSDIGVTTSISRVDRRGLTEPPRWTKVKVGEPFSSTHGYTNYIKAAPDTLFRNRGLVKKYQDKIPKYPNNIYDYYKVDRMVLVGGSVDELPKWNLSLSEINKDIGKQKEVNMVVVLAYNLPREYFHALEEAWIGGKKNDVVLVMGLSSTNQIQWADVMGWTSNELFKIKLRDRVLELKQLERDSLMGVLKEETYRGFTRRSMKDFEYLEASITPTITEWIVSVLIGIFVSLGAGIVMHRNDIFNEERFNFNRYRY